ncbi:hypothetical protein ACQR1Y_12410 [Bradyrhizobium sp. HKCCYLRH3099]|uniref:hypothetical protein n=1 Tax=Bradyrhizobium TaxID=374 RepID=UPI003EB778A5
MSIPGASPVGKQVLGQISDATPVSMSWFVPLSEPARTRPGPRAAAQGAFFFAPLPLVSFGWMAPLSEPPRARPKIAAQVPFMVTDTTPIPVSRINWFMPLSEPVRKRQGLDAARQMFLATPSRLLPTPTVTGRLDAKETKDVFTGGARAWNRVASGEVGTIEKAFTGAEVGVQSAGAVTAKVSIIVR